MRPWGRWKRPKASGQWSSYCFQKHLWWGWWRWRRLDCGGSFRLDGGPHLVLFFLNKSEQSEREGSQHFTVLLLTYKSFIIRKPAPLMWSVAQMMRCCSYLFSDSRAFYALLFSCNAFQDLCSVASQSQDSFCHTVSSLILLSGWLPELAFKML